MVSTPQFPEQPAVLCPRCQKPMLRGEPRPIMFTSGLSDVTYSCKACGTTTIRTINRDGTLHTAAKSA